LIKKYREKTKSLRY